MKITLVSLMTVAALSTAPFASQASDKEVTKPRHNTQARACTRQRQVALFVSGRGVEDQRPSGPMQTVAQAQAGQGNSITFFTGTR